MTTARRWLERIETELRCAAAASILVTVGIIAVLLAETVGCFGEAGIVDAVAIWLPDRYGGNPVV
jgi:hypothetical protein